jgi:hypothetical protein
MTGANMLVGCMERGHQVEMILDFINSHPESYASLTVCRRAIDPGLSQIDRSIIYELAEYLEQAPSEEVAAYYSMDSFKEPTAEVANILVTPSSFNAHIFAR